MAEQEFAVTEPGRKRNWVEGQKGKVDQDSFLKCPQDKRASTEQQHHINNLN